ncbi:hypothetical protein TIFTF001_021888 [Ficus carica]|uniref:Uncharacterized protein n=1 Tax=Ficus carica TaxID=3494 RepID=A0AA88DB60_FICCA|nr:hypothetical protein TIFTF001_021888 [Ficus carica]
MKTAPSSIGSYYFQGYQGTFNAGCPDYDKNYKHLWSFAVGRWLHGQLNYDHVPFSERVPINFRRGLAKYNWFSLSSMSDYSHDLPRSMRPGEVTVAAYMPDPVVHYLARRVNITAKVTTTSERSEVPRGVSVSSTRGLQFDSSSLGAWGSKIADENLEENRAWLSRDRMGVNDQATKTGLPGFSKSSPKRVTTLRAARVARCLLLLVDPLLTSCGSGTAKRKIAAVCRAYCSWEVGRLQVLRSPYCSHRCQTDQEEVLGAKGGRNKVVCFAFSGNAAARGYFNRMEEVASFAVEVKKWKEVDKAAFEKAKKAEESSAKADDARRKVEEARKKAEDDLSIARSEHFRYFQEEGMRDMKSSFAMSNPTVTGTDWSFMLEISGETVAEEDGAATRGAEEREVIRDVQVTEDVVVIDES